MSNFINLYIDESGLPNIGNPKYRFFLITALCMDPREDELAGLLISKWRARYLTSPNKSFHAVDFFEDTTPNYKKRELRMTQRFNQAVKELLDMIHLINFKAEVFYVDLEKIRAHYRIGIPPQPLPDHASQQEKILYRQNKKLYRETVINQMGKKTDFYPLKLCLFRAFKKHSSILSLIPNTKGCVNFESLGTLDGRYVDIYHNYATSDPVYKYGNEIVGMNLHTKASIEGGAIEIADFISYVSTQSLRSEHRLSNELMNISKAKLKELKEIRVYMRQKFKVDLIDITNDGM